MTSFGRYTLVRRVGTGGMAEIWKAKVQGPAGFEKVLAIKKVLPHLVEDSGGSFIDMFIEEAKLVAGLVHPNIVQVFDFGKVGKRDYFIAMEYVSGSNLARIIHRMNETGERMPPDYAVYLVSEAARGLGHAHARTDAAGKPLKIVHRDVSPQNILVSASGEVKVTDFGIAKVASALSMTAEGHVRGKLAYMSPEQARANPLDQRSDLFSLGIVLWELLAGRRLFAGGASSDMFQRVMAYRGLDDDLLAPIPPELRPVLSTLLAMDPANRFQDAVTLEAALSMHLGGGTSFAARQGLAGMVQRLFTEELAAETTLEPAIDAPMSAGATSASSVSTSSAGPVVMGQEVVPATDTVVTPSKSQQTLAPPREAGPTVVVATPSQAFPRPAATRSRGPLFAGVAVTGIVLLGGAFLAGGFVNSLADPTPASSPTATAVAAASVTPAPATPDATPAVDPTAKPRPVRTRAAIAATPKPTPTRRPAGRGYLTVTARPWCEVWLDGTRIARETPLQRFRIPAGTHTLTFKNAPLGFSKDYRIVVSPDEQVSLAIDVTAGTVRPR